MQYAQLNTDGTYSHQITTSGNVEWDENHFCPASALTAEEAAIFHVVPLLETAQPAFDAITQSCQRNGGELVNGQWQYKWAVTALDAATVAANQAAAYAATIPQSVTMCQARLALLGAGLISVVNAAVAGMTGAQGDAARVEWEFRLTVDRHDPLVLALAPALGLTDLQLDTLFVAAAKL